MKISTRWTKHCSTEQQITETHQFLLSALPAFKILEELIEEERRNTNRKALSEDAYRDKNWAYLQADCIGEERAYSKILKLLSIKIEE